MEIGRDAFTGARSLTRSDRRGRSSSRYSDVRLEGEEEDEDDSYRGRKMFGKVMMSGSGHTSEKDKEGSKEFKKGKFNATITDLNPWLNIVIRHLHIPNIVQYTQ